MLTFNHVLLNGDTAQLHRVLWPSVLLADEDWQAIFVPIKGHTIFYCFMAIFIPKSYKMENKIEIPRWLFLQLFHM